MIERSFESPKYERFYRHDAADFLDEFNRIRPHEAINWQRPLERYPQDPEPSNPTEPKQET